LAGLDPLLSLTTSLSSMGAVGLEILLTATSLSIPLFFARRGEFSFSKTVAPLAAGLIIAAITYLSLDNYSALTGTDMVVVNRLPLLFLGFVLTGLLHGLYLRKHRPEIHASVGSTHVEGDPPDLVPPTPSHNLAVDAAARGNA
jgi:hypothetical protein